MNIFLIKIWGIYLIFKVFDYDLMLNLFLGFKFLLYKYIFFDCIYDIFVIIGIYLYYSEINKNLIYFEIEDFFDIVDDIIFYI